ncbi:MAG: HAMP domain-containing histidine kinase [Lachnospiraceae bacterium]|nr:HAMP domain-containing histidine kinase [Lachnospiraceae bacterium]
MGFRKRLVAAFMIVVTVPIVLLIALGIAIFDDRGISIKEAFDAPLFVTDGSGGPSIMIPLFTGIIYISVALLLTAGVMLLWIYRSFVKPLNLLTLATRKMQEGNLDFSIQGDPDDELGNLCEDFEDLRLHLKEQAEARLNYENEVIELISNISHDLKTPLTAIKGYAEGVLDGVADTDEKREKYLRTIYTKASDMQVLVDELAFYSKIDSNIVPYNFENLDINSYFMDCVEDYSIDMEIKGIELDYVPAPDGVVVTADAEQLRRVVNNVIGNSVKYMNKSGTTSKNGEKNEDSVHKDEAGEKKGRITIMARKLENLAEISIRDNGPGISPEDLNRVFERFYRADQSRNSKKGGTGLGLAISKKIIEDHGGTIRAESEPGVHMTIIFTLPLYKEEEVDAIDQGEILIKDKPQGVISRAIDSSKKIIAAARDREGRDRRGYLKGQEKNSNKKPDKESVQR